VREGGIEILIAANLDFCKVACQGNEGKIFYLRQKQADMRGFYLKMMEMV